MLDVSTVSMNAGGEPFKCLVLSVPNSKKTVIFAAGRGGDPSRYLPLLEGLAQHNYSVIAPNFPKLASAFPTEKELRDRARRIVTARMNMVSEEDEVVGVGHSIGASVLMGLNGGQMWRGPDQPCSLGVGLPMQKLALLAPPTGFFKGPNAFENYRVSTSIWVGDQDHITPPEQALFVANNVEDEAEVQVEIVNEAGHFSFMGELPPSMHDPHPDRSVLAETLSSKISEFFGMLAR